MDGKERVRCVVEEQELGGSADGLAKLMEVVLARTQSIGIGA